MNLSRLQRATWYTRWAPRVWHTESYHLLERYMGSVSLRVADHDSWRSAPHYSPTTAGILRHAYALLRGGRRELDSYLVVYNLVRPHLNQPMARHQYLRVAYVMALVFAALEDISGAIAWTDKALALTHELAMPGSRVDLLYLRGQCARAIGRLRDSATNHRQALGLYRELISNDEPADPSLEIGLLTQLAGTEFFLGEYPTVRRRLDDAITLRRRTRVDPLSAAVVEWMQAHLYRWSRQPELALRPAIFAAEIYTESGSPASASRIQSFTADVQLDFAESLPDGSDRTFAVRAAGDHIAIAQALAYEARDEAAMGLALLSAIRHGRLLGVAEARLASAEDVAHLARRIPDNALLAQAYTTIGDELAALGRLDAALSCYSQVLGMLDGSETPALAVWAQSALHRAREQRDGD